MRLLLYFLTVVGALMAHATQPPFALPHSNLRGYSCSSDHAHTLWAFLMAKPNIEFLLPVVTVARDGSNFTSYYYWDNDMSCIYTMKLGGNAPGPMATLNCHVNTPAALKTMRSRLFEFHPEIHFRIERDGSRVPIPAPWRPLGRTDNIRYLCSDIPVA